MFFLNPGHEVSKLVDRKLKVLDDLMESRGEGVIVDIREDVVNPAVLKQELLDAEDKIEDGVSGISISIWFLDFLHKHAECEVELICPQFEDVCLEVFLIFSLSSQLFQLRIFTHNPMFPRIDTFR